MKLRNLLIGRTATLGVTSIGEPPMPVLALKWTSMFGIKIQMLAMSAYTFLDFAEKVTALPNMDSDFEYVPPVNIQVEGKKEIKKSLTIPSWVMKEVEETVYIIAADVTKAMMHKRDSLANFKQMLRESGVTEESVEKILQKSGASPGEGTLQ